MGILVDENELLRAYWIKKPGFGIVETRELELTFSASILEKVGKGYKCGIISWSLTNVSNVTGKVN